MAVIFSSLYVFPTLSQLHLLLVELDKAVHDDAISDLDGHTRIEELDERLGSRWGIESIVDGEGVWLAF